MLQGGVMTPLLQKTRRGYDSVLQKWCRRGFKMETIDYRYYFTPEGGMTDKRNFAYVPPQRKIIKEDRKK